MEKEFSWYKLDNAAKVFPDISGRKRTNMFRICMKLTEDVDSALLQQALESLKSRFPTFFVKMKTGMFWYYYEYNEYMPKVKPESPYICCLPDKRENHGYLFNVCYYANRISVEVFHALSDGTGVVELTKALVFRYLQLKGYPVESEGLVKTYDSNPHVMEIEDSFIKNYDNSGFNRGDTQYAHMPCGTAFGEKDGLGIINGKFPVEQIKNLAKESDCTITAYLAAVALYSMFKTDFNSNLYSKRPLKLVMPVNLRKFYDSKTLRNFSLVIYIPIVLDGRVWSFEEILEVVKTDMKEKLVKENIQKLLNANVRIEKNYSMKLAPLFLKKMAIKIGYHKLGSNLATCSLSNLGEIKLPVSMQKYVNDIEWNMSCEYRPSYNMTVCSYNGRMCVTFVRSVYETSVMREYFRFLSRKGVDVTIESNLWEEHA